MSLVVLVAAGACEGMRVTPVVVRDSSGIAIVENRWERMGVEWSVDPAPVVDWGQLGSPPGQTFDRIRSVRRLADGRVVVGDGGSQEIRVFSSGGDVQVRIGGEGEGPGEFRYLETVEVIPGDSLVAHDSGLRRLSVFSGSGDLAAEWRLPAVGSELVGRLSEGVYLFTNGSALLPADGALGLVRTPRHYVAYDVRTARADTVATLPGYEFFNVAREDRTASYEIPFARDAFHAMGPEGWFTGRNDNFQVEYRNREGQVRWVARVTGAEVPLTGNAIRELEAATVERLNPNPAGLEAIQRLFREVEPPELQPAYSMMIAGRAGEVWIADWRSPFAERSADPRRWWVFDGGGVFLAQVMLPGSFDAEDAGADWVVGIQHDSLGVERVQILQLRRDVVAPNAG